MSTITTQNAKKRSPLKKKDKKTEIAIDKTKPLRI
jgi:hypothetical protein